jgi:hypothetical protein
MTETGRTYGTGERPTLADLNTKLDILVEQVARLTEVLTVGLSDLKNFVERQALMAERQTLTIERRSLAIGRLALMLEKRLE